MTPLLDAFTGPLPWPHWEAPGGSVLLINADCRDVMGKMRDGAATSCVSDPPYGVQIAGWDDEAPPNSLLTECLRVSAGPVVWFGAAVVRAILPVMRYEPPPDRVLIWAVTFSLSQVATNGMFYRWHPIWCWRLPKTQDAIHRDVLTVNTEATHNSFIHPGKKPLPLMRQLSEGFGGSVVLEPFSGSGTTAVACIQTGRRCIAVEISPDYYAIGVKRCQQALDTSASFFGRTVQGTLIPDGSVK